MIVYGDASCTEDAATLVAHMRACLAACAAAPTLDQLRALLIRVGQFEQAAADAPLSAAFHARAAALTGLAARAFYAAWRAETGACGPLLHQMQHALDGLDAPPGCRFMVKVPEGFAFYALFPDHYIMAARRWLRDHADVAPRAAAVIGVRSIGTTLAATMAAVLEDAGWHVTRMTVRPDGHPFERQADLGGVRFSAGTWALVVDEGPGMSGSSMAAAAAAAQRAGVARARIAFVPGHAGAPGSAASDEVRHWWHTTPRYPATAEALQIGGVPLVDALAAATERLCDDAVVRVEDFGGGLWRRAVYAHEDGWPPVCASFERPKYRMTLRSGRMVLWKFGGLAGAPGMRSSTAEAEAATLNERAAQGWGPAALGVAHGFVAMPWLDGAALRHADITPELLAHMGRYIAAVAGPPLRHDEQEQALDRAGEILYWNVWEALGEALAERTRSVLATARAAAEGRLLPTYGDGRLAPHEWLRHDPEQSSADEPQRTPGSQRSVLPLSETSVSSVAQKFQKLDSTGHSTDHTAVGRQPVAWDIAGAIVEWRLDHAQARHLLDAYRAAGGAPLSAPLLAGYRLAYAAFRLGQTTMCAHMSHAEAEQARLWRAAEEYRALLADALRHDE